MSGRISDMMRDKPAKQLPAIPGHKPPDGGKPPAVKAKRASDLQDESCDDLNVEADSCAVTVAVRVRPFATREISDPRNRRVVSMEGTETIVQATDSSPVHRFQYDYSFDSFDPRSSGFSNQLKVYESLAQPLLTRAFQGYNTCLFAYGQTGSGKSYSIMGHGDDDGVIPRFAEELFQKANNLQSHDTDVTAINVETSFFEIYNEKIHDLLAVSKGSQANKQNLKVREHPEQGPYVEGLSTFPVASFDDIVGLLTLGNRQRATASTGMNDKSSRSHSVFTMHLTQSKTMDFEESKHEHSVVSRINLVDLAGSERQSTAQTSGVRLKEGASINKSLLTLGKVISVLAEQSSQSKKKKLFVPYRDSVLTWLLRESLGGNARTAMIATISPSSLNLEETLSTLRYAQQARSILNSARVNEDPKARLIRELRAEIDRLRAEQTGQGGDDLSTMQEILDLRKALKEKELNMETNQKVWQLKLKRAEEKLKQESSALEHTGIALTSVNNKLPNLVNLNEDPQLSEILLYILEEGQTKVGRQGADEQNCDIQLSGALVSDYHCMLLNERGQVSITPIDKDAPTFVNGQQISNSVTLQHGDRVIIGGDHYFRFNYPASLDSAKRKSTGVPKDFQFAKAEIEKAQNKRLESERQKIQGELEKQMAEQLQEVEVNYNQQLKDQKREYESQLQKIQSDMLKQRAQSPVRSETLPEVPTAERLLSSLRAEKLKLTESHARLKHKQKYIKEELAVKSIASVPTERGKTDLYKVTLLIREANKLSQIKGMPTVFSQEEVDDVVVVRVTDSELSRYTYLTVAKFEERLADMRESLDNEETHDDSVAVFCNPRDTWRSSAAPGHHQATSLNDILNNENKLTSMELVINSSQNSTHYSKKGKQRSRLKATLSNSLFNVCKDFVSYSLQKHKAISGGARKIFDSILHQCELSRIAITNILNRYREAAAAKPAEFEADEETGACCLQLVTSSEVLLEQCQLCSCMCEDIESTHIADTVNRMSELSNKISRQIIHLMQALSGNIDKVVTDSSASLLSAVLELCKLCGVMSLITDTAISMESNVFLQLSPDVQMACARGSMEQCVHTATQKMSSAHESVNYIISGAKTTFANEAIYDAVSKVLRKVETFLTDYRDDARTTLSTVESTRIEFDACHRYELCSQAVASLNTIGDNLGALCKPMFTQGKEYDRAIVLKAANTIKSCCRKLASDSQLDVTALVGAVNLLFRVTEAEGKVIVHHKSAENRTKRLLPQVGSVEKMKRVLPPSPDANKVVLSPFTKSPPKNAVLKLTAMFENGSDTSQN